MDSTYTNTSTTAQPLTLEALQEAVAGLPPLPNDYLIEAHGKVWKFKEVELADYPPGAVIVSPAMAARFRATVPDDVPIWGVPIYEEDDESKRAELVMTCCKQVAKRLPLPDFIRAPRLSLDPWAAAPRSVAETP